MIYFIEQIDSQRFKFLKQNVTLFSSIVLKTSVKQFVGNKSLVALGDEQLYDFFTI